MNSPFGPTLANIFAYIHRPIYVLLHFFSFFQGMQTRERAHCARSVFPFIKKKFIKKKKFMLNPVEKKIRDLDKISLPKTNHLFF